MILTLTRDPVQPHDYCTLGRLAAAGHAFDTVERPWVPGPAGTVCGHSGTSCIGVGTYRLDPRDTEAKGRHWILSNAALGVYRYPQDVPSGAYARSLVLIHIANWAHELLGCIAPGTARAQTNGEWGVSGSRDAMNALRVLLLNVPDLELVIT